MTGLKVPSVLIITGNAFNKSISASVKPGISMPINAPVMLIVLMMMIIKR